MSKRLFTTYRSKGKSAPVAAARIERETIRPLSQFTGATAISKKVPGGSVVYSEIMLHGDFGKVGDYVVALDQAAFKIVKQDEFHRNFNLIGE